VVEGDPVGDDDDVCVIAARDGNEDDDGVLVSVFCASEMTDDSCTCEMS
jgi:hypothetical protein